MGSTISSLTRSSFRSVPTEGLYHSDSFHSVRRPRSIDNTSIPSRGQEFLSPSDARIEIAPSSSSSLHHTSYMMDLDEYVSPTAPASEAYKSTSFDMPLLPVRAPGVGLYPGPFTLGRPSRQRRLLTGLFRTHRQHCQQSPACRL
jgi:hypothetical protein